MQICIENGNNNCLPVKEIYQTRQLVTNLVTKYFLVDKNLLSSLTTWKLTIVGQKMFHALDLQHGNKQKKPTHSTTRQLIMTFW
jgi:hypothetical protein